MYAHCIQLSLAFTVFILNIAVLQAQQLLNLDFEKPSAEGLARPWGWNTLA